MRFLYSNYKTICSNYSTNEIKEELMDTSEVFGEDNVYFSDDDLNGDSVYTEIKKSIVKLEKSSPKKKRKRRTLKELKEEDNDDDIKDSDIKKAKNREDLE